MLALVFAGDKDYDRILEDDTIDIIGLENFNPESPLFLVLHHTDGTSHKIQVNHTYNEQQIGWFKAGSALNLIAEEAKKA